MATLKYSRQRESIREFVKASKEHPTADDVYAAIRKEYPNISLGTVYRNLSLLVELDEIVKVPTGDGPDRFDGNAKPHSHFICTRCHNIFDIEDEHLTGLTERVAKNFDISIGQTLSRLSPRATPCKQLSLHTAFHGISLYC